MKSLKNIFAITLLMFLCSCKSSGQKQKEGNYKELINQTYELLNSNRFEKALEISKKLININPKDFEGYYLLGVSQKGLGDCKSAIRSFSTAITLKQTFVNLYYFRAECYLAENKKDSSFFDLHHSLKVDTTFEYESFAGKFLRENFSEAYSEEMSFKLNNQKVDYSYNDKGEKHGNWKAYYSNGSIQREGNFLNGEKDGYDKRYFENGQLHYIQYFKNGVANGKYKSYHKNGQLATEATLINDKFHGVKKDWFETGELESEFNYKDGQLHGLQTTRSIDGKIILEGNYKNGKLDGETKVWDELFQKYNIENYKDGELIEKK